MDWPRVDYHTHICAHPIDEMLERAASVGVREYGISEHIFQLDEGRGIFPAIPEEGRRFSRDEYVGIVADARDRSGLRVRLGLEVDFVPGTEVAVRGVLDGVSWDYLIGSIHQIGELDIFEYTPSTPSECRELWRRYYQLFIDAASSGMFDILSHPARNSLPIRTCPTTSMISSETLQALPRRTTLPWSSMVRMCRGGRRSWRWWPMHAGALVAS